jgi:hypothetical protein
VGFKRRAAGYDGTEPLYAAGSVMRAGEGLGSKLDQTRRIWRTELSGEKSKKAFKQSSGDSLSASGLENRCLVSLYNSCL